MDKPKFTIRNFNKNNIYWLRGMLPVKVGGNSILTPAYYAHKQYDDDDISSLSTISNITGMSEMYFESITEFGESPHLVLIEGDSITAQYIYMIPRLQGIIGKDFGEIHQAEYNTGYNSSQGISGVKNADVIITKNNTLLYTNSTRLGLGYYRKATGGSATTLIDTATNFDTLGCGTSDWNKEIFDFQLGNSGEKFVITSITTTTNTNDTLNFTAGTGTPATDDEFMVFVDDKFDFAVNRNTRHQHFYGQRKPENWKRQIELFGDDYFIGNGNYLASLNVDESTFSATAKQLPEMTQFQCMKVNNDKILVGGEYRNNKGKLLLWDGWNDGWLSILDTVNIPISIVAYQSGWIVAFSDGSIYYTDGYILKSLTNILDTEIEIGYTYPADNFNSMILFQDRLFIGVYASASGCRQRNGIHIYDIKQDIWSYTPIKTKYDYNNEVGAVQSLYSISFQSGANHDWQIYYGFVDCVGYITQGASPNEEVWLKIQLPYAQKISQIGLNLGYKYWKTDSIFDKDHTTDVNVSIGDGRKPVSGYIQVKDTSTVSKLIPSSSSYRGYVEKDNEIEIIGNYHENAGEYTFVTSVDDSGEATEAWNISPSFTTAPNDTRLCVLYNVKKCNTVEIDLGDIDKEILFNVPDFYSDILWLHIRIGTTYKYIDINSINLY